MKNKIIATICVLIFAAILYFLPISCVFLELTGIPCPGCGMTRALLAALQLDFNTAFSYHAMFWSIPILYVAVLRDGKLFPKKWMNIVFYAVIFAGFMLNWVEKLI